MYSTNGVELRHPSYCAPCRCSRRGPDLHHRSAHALYVPRQPGATEASLVGVTVERLDEIDERTRQQIEHPTEVILDYADRRVRWGIEDFQAVTDLALGLYHHGQIPVPVPVPVP